MTSRSRRRPPARRLRGAVVALALAAAAACAKPPRYTVPAAAVPPAYKEIGDWKAAEPKDQAARGTWWQIFRDDRLDALEEQVSSSNQTLKASQASFAAARAAVGVARAAQFPQVGSGLVPAAIDNSLNKPLWNLKNDSNYPDYLLRGDVAYELDVWGRVGQTLGATRAQAQASAADLEAVSLALHAELALDYFQLRGLDAERQILDSTVAAYARALELTENRHRGGLASASDVALAETQLESTRAQLIDVGVRRALFEHAIAALTGQPAGSFSLPPAPLSAAPPAIPAGLPADVLERRPDIAAAERRVAAANLQVGAARSAFFPVLALTGSTGFESIALGSWLRAASNFWTLAPAAALAVFDGGRRRSVSEQARAGYERSAALYRDTLLTAFREVEDNLAALRILADEARTQDAAVAAAERSLALSTNRYRGGVASYLEVIATQYAALNNQRAAVNLLTRRMAASVLLIKALGGGWTAAALKSNASQAVDRRP